jgi:hypothetical protein
LRRPAPMEPCSKTSLPACGAHPRSQRARAAQSPKPSLQLRKAPRSRRVENPGGSRSP